MFGASKKIGAAHLTKRRAFLCATTFAMHVGWIVGLYYLRIPGLDREAMNAWRIVGSDFVVFFLPFLLALGLYLVFFKAHRGWSTSVALSIVLACIGWFVAMLIALNTWGS